MLGVPGSVFRVQDSGLRVQSSGFRVQGFGSRAQGSRFKMSGFGLGVEGVGCMWGCGREGLRVWVAYDSEERPYLRPIDFCITHI